LPDTSGNFEEFAQNSINSHRTPAAKVKTFHDVNDFFRDSIFGCNVTQGLSVNAINSFAEVDKLHQNVSAMPSTYRQFVSA